MMHARFLHKSTPGQIIEACGSDSFLQLDGRARLSRQTLNCMERIHALSRVQKYIGFAIYRGTLFNNTELLRAEVERKGLNEYVIHRIDGSGKRLPEGILCGHRVGRYSAPT